MESQSKSSSSGAQTGVTGVGTDPLLELLEEAREAPAPGPVDGTSIDVDSPSEHSDGDNYDSDCEPCPPGPDQDEALWQDAVVHELLKQQEQQDLDLDLDLGPGRGPPPAPNQEASLPKPAESEAEAVRPRSRPLTRAASAAPAGPRIVHDALSVKSPAGNIVGTIRFKPSSLDLFATCSFHANCTKTKTCKPSTRSRQQGRLKAFLAAWCQAGMKCETKDEHVYSCRPGFDERVNARALLGRQPNCDQFFAHERPKYDDEEGDEPENCV